MPVSVSARRSSIGNRRNSQTNKPYRGDQLQVGKKTGYAVRQVQPESDGFEPFDDLIGQADKYTPPKVANKRKKREPPTPLPEEDFDDDFGEQSMDVDSPVKYMNSARQISVPSSMARVGSSSRPVRRSSAIDFDELPSPRHTSSIRTAIFSATSSRLSKPYSLPNISSRTAHDDDFGGAVDDEPLPAPSPPRSISFNELDQEDEAPLEFSIPDPSTPPVLMQRDKNKGKGKAPPPPEEEEGPAGMDNGPDQFDYAGGAPEQETPQPSPKPVEKLKPKPKKPRKPKPVPVAGSDDENEHPNGLRRSKRQKFDPLEWWRQEKILYGVKRKGVAIVPEVKEVYREPQELPKPLSKRRRGTTRGKSRGVTVEVLDRSNPEEGWDDDTPQTGIVIDYATQEEVERRIGFTAKDFNPKPAAGNDWFFQKIFGDGDFVAAGQLTIPVGKRKPSKATKDNTYIFFVHEGAVNVKLHNQSMIFATGAMFMVPRGNTYFIENIAEREAKLVFTQARKIPEDESITPPPEDRRRSVSGHVSASAEQPEEEEEEEEEGPAPKPRKKPAKKAPSRT